MKQMSLVVSRLRLSVASTNVLVSRKGTQPSPATRALKIDLKQRDRMNEEAVTLVRELEYWRYQREKAARACQDLQKQNTYEWLDLARVYGSLARSPPAESQDQRRNRHLLVALLSGGGVLTYDDRHFSDLLFKLD